MKKFGVIISIIAIYFFTYFLQVNFFNWFTIDGVSPNLFILLVLLIGMFVNSKVGAILGFFLGLYTDFLFSNSIGISAILFAILGFCGEFLEKRFSRDSKLTIVLISSIATLFYEILFFIVRIVIYSANINIISFVYTLGIEIIYNAFLVIILYPLIHKFGLYVESVFKNNKIPTRYF